MKHINIKSLQKTVIGWREWIALPDLGIPWVKAKIDTGAKTSCLHAYKIKQIDDDYIEFRVHPLQRDSDTSVICKAKLVDHRLVKSSSGHTQMRYVIQTTMCLGDIETTIELTLTNRSDMGFRMLLGREALSKLFLVESSKSFIHTKLSKSDIKKVY